MERSIGNEFEPADIERLHQIVNKLQPSAKGPLTGRLMVDLYNRPTPHVGHGTGTQLSFALAEALRIALVEQSYAVQDLIDLTGRGKRSGIGCYGYFQGGFLVDAGHREKQRYPTLVAQHRFPEHWPILLIEPFDEVGLAGEQEQSAFEQISTQQAPSTGDLLRTQAMSNLLLQSILPAVIEDDYASFGPALAEFNRLSGEWFAEVQGGCYASPYANDVLRLAHKHKVTAVGQSSWGPLMFAICPDRSTMHELMRACHVEFADSAMIYTATANNVGRQIEVEVDLDE